MTVGKAIYYLLNNSTDLEAVVGTRIFPEVAAQDSALPFVMYSVISNEPSDTHSGPSLLDVAQVDVVLYNTSYTGCVDMGVYVRAALDRVSGTYNGVNVQSCQYNSEVIDFDEYKRAYVITQSYDVRISRTEFEIAQGTPVTGARLGDLYDVTDDATTGQVIIKQADGTWAAGDATSDIEVINLTGSTITAGSALKANGVQGGLVSAALYAPTDSALLFLGLAVEDIEPGETGAARQMGVIENLDTSAYAAGTILYPFFGGQLNSTPVPPAFGYAIPCAYVLQSDDTTGQILVRTSRPHYALNDLNGVDTSGVGNGQSLVYDGIAKTWGPGNTVPRTAADLADVFDYGTGESLTSGTLLSWNAFNRYWAPTPKASFLPPLDTYFLQKYNSEADTAATGAATDTITIERLLTVQADGHGVYTSQQTDTPTSGNVIVRKIWHKANSFEDSDVDTWTLVHTFADDTAYADTTATFDALLNAQTYGTIPMTIAQSWEDIPPFTGLLDDYPGAAAAYSLRLLDSTYTGDAIRVRRASDNAEQDIGFVDNDLDTSALATFCAGTDGFVVRWYDQSGNGNDATQSTTSDQPKIYDSVTGVVQDNGKPAVEFDSKHFQGVTRASATANTIAFVGSTDSTTSGRVFGNPNVGGGQFDINGGNWLYRDYQLTPTIFSTATQSAVSGQQVLLFMYVTTANKTARLAKNGSAYATGTTLTNNLNMITTAETNVQIGKARDGVPANYYDGKIQEIILYTSDESANRTGIETNINDFYSIY